MERRREDVLTFLLSFGSRLEDGSRRGGSFFSPLSPFSLCVSCLSVCEVAKQGREVVGSSWWWGAGMKRTQLLVDAAS